MFDVLVTSLALSASAIGAPLDQTIQRVEAMTHDATVRQLAHNHGLDVVNVTWEDTGRFNGSSVGPNISDMTIGVRDSAGALHPMPVLRFNNFTDKTADVDVDDFWLPMGNAWGDEQLQTVGLRQVLSDTRRYLHDPRSWAGNARSLWAARDEHVLVSAQACFLPVPRAGEATFTPVLYNYQSRPDAPAVLTMVATRQGTSIQIIENDGGYLSEPLFFNENGQRAPFTAARLSDVQSGRVDPGPGGALSAAGEDGANVVLVLQVPLKQEAVDQWMSLDAIGYAAPMSEGAVSTRSAPSDVEAAVVSHGPTEGPFKELDGLEIERDDRFPVRVTVQFYQATSNGVVTDADVARLRAQIDRVYGQGDWVGSLVTQGVTGRPTAWTDAPRARWADSSMGWHRTW